jgi:hypothetical protein
VQSGDFAYLQAGEGHSCEPAGGGEEDRE